MMRSSGEALLQHTSTHRCFNSNAAHYHALHVHHVKLTCEDFFFSFSEDN